MAKKLLLSGFVIAFLAITGIYCYRNAGNWLLVSDPEPQRIDLIFSFAGGPFRDDHSIELLKKHSESKWLSSTGRYNSIIELCKNSEIDTSRVTIIDTCTNTWNEINALSEYLNSNKWITSVGLVSNEWHMRRVKQLASKQIAKGIHVFYLPVPLEKSGPNRVTFRKWWKFNVTKTIVESEITKIGFYLLIL